MTSQNKIEYLDEQQNVIVIHDKDRGTYPMYILKGEKNYLVDCGIAPRAHTLKADLKEALQGEGIDVLLLTHSHFDHVGAASFLQDIYGFQVYGSYETVEMLSNEDLREMINHNNRGLQELYEDVFDPSIQLEQLKDLQVIGQGDKLQLDSTRYIEVIASPGHSSCALSYLLQPHNILFPGDSAGMIEKDGSYKPVFFGSFKQYQATLNMLAGLHPHILAPAHAHYIKGDENIQAYFQKAGEAALELKDKMLASLSRSQDPMAIAQDLAEKEFFPGTVMGTRDAHIMNLRALAMVVKREFLTTTYR